MRILRLDLLAFGPFTGESIDFPATGPGLHIVYGPNEAGKSSSLRALQYWLFGIPNRCTDNFLHPYRKLRIGGLLEKSDGTRLEFIRRKARTKTLRNPDDATEFDERRLCDLLEGVTAESFSKQFGIDYEELRRGGEAIVRGGGDVGETLFAAGAGFVDLAAVQQSLDNQADALFKPQGTNPRINQLLDELKSARRTLRETQLSTAQWVSQDKALQEATARKREIDQNLAEERADTKRLERISKSLPLIGRRKQLRDELTILADAPLLPETFPADRREAETNLANARNEQQASRREIERLKQALAELHVPVALLEHRTAITQLYADLGSHRKAAQDRPKLVSRREDAQRQALDILRELGRPAHLQEIDDLHLPRMQRQRIQELAGECKALIERQQSCEKTIVKLETDIASVQQALTELPATRDVGDLERAIRAAQQPGDLELQRDEGEHALAKLRRQADVDLEKLIQFEGTLEELEALPVPAAETIDRFDRAFAETTHAADRVAGQIEDLTRTIERLQKQLDTLRLERDVPTEEDLAAARRHRDAGWEAVRQLWQSGVSTDHAGTADFVAQFIEQFAPDSDLAEAFRVSIERADILADRLRREADCIAKQAQLMADLRQAERQRQQEQEKYRHAVQQQNRVLEDWQAQWTPTGIIPLQPQEMRIWRTHQQALAATVAQIRDRRADLDQLSGQISSLRRMLSERLCHLGHPPLEDSERLTSAIQKCQHVVDVTRANNQSRKMAEDRLAGLQQTLLEVQQQKDESRRVLDQWRTDWADAVAAIGLDARVEPAQANAVIELIDESFSLLKDVHSLEERIGGIDRDAASFEQRVCDLLHQVAEDLLSKPISQAVADLYDRLERAVTDSTKAESWQEQLEKEEARCHDASARIEQWEQTCEDLCRQALCRNTRELPEAEKRSSRRRAIENEIADIDRQLSELAAGTSLDAWIAESEPYDSDELQAQLINRNDSIAALESQQAATSEAIGKHGNELSRMDGSDLAAATRVQIEHLLAAIRGESEQYARLRLASAVLSRATERFRQATQGPVLSRAAELFSELTLGSFAGLRADYDDAGNAVLVGVRPGSSEAITVEGMSDGTCDQLYLALRLALLESSLDGRESLPLIVDDILVMFDDLRAAAALKALARLSEKTQIIFFTHHEHLIEVARETMDESRLCIRQLGSSGLATIR